MVNPSGGAPSRAGTILEKAGPSAFAEKTGSVSEIGQMLFA
jgi:hypothetical protein